MTAVHVKRDTDKEEGGRIKVMMLPPKEFQGLPEYKQSQGKPWKKSPLECQRNPAATWHHKKTDFQRHKLPKMLYFVEIKKDYAKSEIQALRGSKPKAA